MPMATLSYILAPQRLAVGDTVVSGANVDVKPGNAMPIGADAGWHDRPQRRNQARCRRFARPLGRHLCDGRWPRSGYVIIKLKSGETRMVAASCMAIGRCCFEPRPSQRSDRQGRPRPLEGLRVRSRAVSPATRSTIRTVAVPTAVSTGQRPGASRPRARRPVPTSARHKFIVRSRHERKKSQ